MNAAARNQTGTGERSLSDAELELYADGTLAPDRAAQVERSLAGSPADAARLDELRAIDADIRAALLAPARRGARPSERRRGGQFTAAAALLVITGLVVLIRAGGTAPSTPPSAPTPTIAVTPPRAAPPVQPDPVPPSPGEYEPVRIVMSIPAPAAHRPAQNKPRLVVKTGADAVEPTVPPASTTAKAIASTFGDASDAGIRRAVAAINDASPEDRAAALATIGQTLRSGSTAVRILDKLGPREQVAVCSELALDASLRAVALQRLRDLTDNPDVGADARAAVRALAAAPGMKPWLRSYGLLEDPPKPASLERTPLIPAIG